MNVSGIGQSKFNNIKDFITVTEWHLWKYLKWYYIKLNFEVYCFKRML